MMPPTRGGRAAPERARRPALTDGQARHLRVRLVSLLADAEGVLERASRADPHDQPWLAVLRPELEKLARTVRETASVLGLPIGRDEVDPRRRMAAWASSWWASILDCRPSALKAYGAVDPALEGILTPRLEAAAELLHRIAEVSARSRR